MNENELIDLFERRGYRCIRTLDRYHALPATDIVKGDIKKHARSIVEISWRDLPAMTKDKTEQWLHRAITTHPEGRAFDINKQYTILRGKEPIPPTPTKPALPIKEGRIIDIMKRRHPLIPGKQAIKTIKETAQAAQVAHDGDSKLSCVKLFKQMRKPVPSRITQSRYDVDMSIAEFAHELCITEEELQAWEDGTIAPTQGQIIALASRTSYPMLWFYGDVNHDQ